ncbi:MAG: DNA replication/repair protein RecF [Clostridiales bacterium]|nr:DNA replication/repair protein RecF [Clostridiales bacterium]MCF8021515.1 DNA replication/repair protein RecF [Clostridiales bacterium]
MYLQNINLNYFRNYIQENWKPSKGINLITGDNAQGKTNLLEAIYMGTSIKSFRTKNLSEIINWYKKISELNFFFCTLNGSNKLVYKINQNKKTINLNDKNIRFIDMLKYPPAIVFTPDDLDIVKGNPDRRRKYIDFELGLLDYNYDYYLRKYKKIIYERNNLLKDIKYKNNDNNLLETWNQQLVLIGTQIIIKRLNLLQKFVPFVKNVFYQLTDNKESLDIRYLSSIKISEDIVHEKIQDIFNQELLQSKDKEIERGQTLKGPHRDDLMFYINGSDCRYYGSRGQQRTIVLSLKISLIKIWYHETGEYPILLLDDVLQELDDKKQEYFFLQIKDNIQTFLTTSTEKQRLFKGIGNCIEIIDGKIYWRE